MTIRLPVFLENYINNKYVSKRGLLKYWYHKILMAIGFYNKYSIKKIDYIPSRYVFVCAGNICRSPLAEAVARRCSVDAASFGLDTRGNDPADPRAIEFAAQMGLDLTSHLTTKASDFEFKKGDVVVAMEPKHISMCKDKGYTETIVLLGLSSKPRLPYIADPYSANHTNFQQIESIVTQCTQNLVKYGKA